MSPSSQTSFISDEEHAAEVAKQEKIAAELVASTPQVAGTPAEEPPVEAPKVKLVPVGDIEYPLSVSLVGLEDELVFADENASAEVTPEVAEQVRYLSNVEIAA